MYKINRKRHLEIALAPIDREPDQQIHALHQQSNWKQVEITHALMQYRLQVTHGW